MPGSADGLCCPLSSNCQTRERHVGLSVALRDCLPSVRVKPSSRLPRSFTWRGFAGRLAALEGSPSPCRCWYRSQPSRQAALRYIVEKRGAFQVPASRSRRGPRGPGLSVGRSSAWNQGRRWRQRTTRSPTAAGPKRRRSGAARSADETRVPWSHHCSARERSARGLDDGATRVVELAALREGDLLRPCGHFRTPRREIVMVAGALDEGRIDSVPLCQIYGVLESARKDSGHDSTWQWPLFHCVAQWSGWRLRPRRNS